MPDSENMLKLCYSLNTIPEGLYYELTKKWKEEVKKGRVFLKENKNKRSQYER
jgi:hypothetical protein